MRFLGLAFAVMLTVALAPSCLVDKRTTDFDCSDTKPCASDRMCESGFCVLLDPTVCGDNCTGVGGECMGSTCQFDCDSADCGSLVCPGQLSRQINCTGAGACTNTSITCGSAQSCTINCGGPDSCGQRLVTGTGSTAVNCTGARSCAGGTDCDDACSCTVNCGGTDSCGAPADCHGSSVQCANGNGCALGGACKNDC